MRLRRRTASAVIGTLVGLLLSYFLLSTAGGSGGVGESIRKIITVVARSDPGLLLGAFSLFLLSQVARALRWMALSFGRRVPFSLSMPVTSVHIGLGHLLPIRLSDVAFVGLLRHLGAVPVGYGTATVVFAKMLDLVAMGTVIVSAIAAGVGDMALIAPLLVVAGLAGILLLRPVLRLLGPPVRWVLARLGRSGAESWFDDLLAASAVRGRRTGLLAGFGLSMVAWVSKLSMFCLILAALGVTGIPLWKVFFASGVTDLTMALPVHGLLSMGTVEAGWAAGFAMVGVEGMVGPGVSIVELGFGVHIVWMLMAVSLMLLAVPWLLIGRSRLRWSGADGAPKGGGPA